MTRTKSTCLALLAVLLSPMAANAVPIGLGDFDGSESIIDFNSVTFGTFTGSFSTMGVTVTPESGSYRFQNQFSGRVLGTSGAAFDTGGNVSSRDHDVTITFDEAISKFGVNFGTSDNDFFFLSAVVYAFDRSGTLVESQSFPSFQNTFVGFDFSNAVTSVLLDRVDDLDPNLATFVDDIRYQSLTAVPEPGTLALLGLGLAGMGFARRKKKA